MNLFKYKTNSTKKVELTARFSVPQKKYIEEINNEFRAWVNGNGWSGEASIISSSVATSRVSESVLKCSFCGKSQDNVKKLVAGPGVYICDECIDLCNELVDGKEEKEG